jgi:hypothetical protein
MSAKHHDDCAFASSSIRNGVDDFKEIARDENVGK